MLDPTCKECKAHGEFIHKETIDFLTGFVKKASDTGLSEHLPAPIAMLVVLGVVGDFLKISLDIEIKRIAEHADSEEDAEQEIHAMIDTCIQSFFETANRALPIDIHAQGGIDKGDGPAIQEFIEGLAAKRDPSKLEH